MIVINNYDKQDLIGVIISHRVGLNKFSPVLSASCITKMQIYYRQSTKLLVQIHFLDLRLKPLGTISFPERCDQFLNLLTLSKYIEFWKLKACHYLTVAVSCGYDTCFAVKTCDGLYHFIFSTDLGGIPLGFQPIIWTFVRHTVSGCLIFPAFEITWSVWTNCQ